MRATLDSSLQQAQATKQSRFACRIGGTDWLHCSLPVIATKQSILSARRTKLDCFVASAFAAKAGFGGQECSSQ
jgi:hypothetical protein